MITINDGLNETLKRQCVWSCMLNDNKKYMDSMDIKVYVINNIRPEP